MKTVMSVASYVLAIGGMTLLLVAIIQANAIHVRYIEVRTMLVQLLRTDPARAEAMCRRVPGSLLDAFGSAMKIAAKTGTRDPAIISASTRPTYDAKCSTLVMAWKKLVGRGKMGGMMVIAGLVMAMTKGKFPILLFVFLFLAIIGFVWLLGRKAELDRAILLGRAEVLPEIDRMVADGRYRTA